MFNSARLKLTAWYLLVIMAVSLAFSVVIFRVEVLELDRLAHSPRFRVPEEIIEDATNRRLANLIIINLGILVIAGTSGYFLAGRTLKPIKEMIDDQNRFIGDASHELRTPLTAIKSALEVNLTDKKLLRACLDQVDKLQSLTEGLLQFSHESPRFQKIKLAEIVNDALKIVGPKAKQKNITIKTFKSEASIMGDKAALTNLVTLLVDNAIKYSPKKSEVIIALRKDGFSVTDQGIGIDTKDMPHIFDRFYRADSARTKSDGGGYGLGLSIAKKIVEAHHGTIKVESKVDLGTTFSVNFS